MIRFSLNERDIKLICESAVNGLMYENSLLDSAKMHFSEIKNYKSRLKAYKARAEAVKIICNKAGLNELSESIK